MSTTFAAAFDLVDLGEHDVVGTNGAVAVVLVDVVGEDLLGLLEVFGVLRLKVGCVEVGQSWCFHEEGAAQLEDCEERGEAC